MAVATFFFFIQFLLFRKMRPIIYPEAEQLIQNKKRQKLVAGIEEERHHTNPSGRKGES